MKGPGSISIYRKRYAKTNYHLYNRSCNLFIIWLLFSLSLEFFSLIPKSTSFLIQKSPQTHNGIQHKDIAKVYRSVHKSIYKNIHKTQNSLVRNISFREISNISQSKSTTNPTKLYSIFSFPWKKQRPQQQNQSSSDSNSNNKNAIEIATTMETKSRPFEQNLNIPNEDKQSNFNDVHQIQEEAFIEMNKDIQNQMTAKFSESESSKGQENKKGEETKTEKGIESISVEGNVVDKNLANGKDIDNYDNTSTNEPKVLWYRNSNFDEKEIDKLWIAQKKALLRIGSKGVQKSHRNSLKELIQSHPQIKVKINNNDEDIRPTVEELLYNVEKEDKEQLYVLLKIKGREALIASIEDPMKMKQAE